MRLPRILRRRSLPAASEDSTYTNPAGTGGRSSDRRRSNKRKGPQHVAIHGGPVDSVVFLSDGEHVVTGCRDGSIQQWNLSNRREMEPSMRSDGAVKAVAASPDGKWIISGGTDCKVTIWDAITHKKVGETVELDSKGITALDISPDSSYFAAGSEGGSVIVSRLNTREVAGQLGRQEAQISSVKFSPTSDQLASACAGWHCGSIRIWHSHTGCQLACISPDNQPAYSLAWSSDGKQLFAGGPRGSIKRLNITTQSVSSRIGNQQSDAVTSLSLSNNDRFLVAGSASSCSLSFWDVDTCQLIHPTLYLSSELLTVAISPDNFSLVSSGTDKKITIRNLRDDIPLSYFKLQRLAPSLKCLEAFTYMSKAVYEAWIDGDLVKTENILSEEIKKPDWPEPVHYLFANRALVWARRHAWDKALEDTQIKFDDAHLPLLVHIARAFALFGKGNHVEGTEEFDLVLRDCDSDARPFLELIKFIILFEVGLHNEPEVIGYSVDCSVDVKLMRSVVKAQMLFLLAERAMAQQDYQRAIHLLTLARDLGPFIHVPELRTISIVFGWNLDDLGYTIRQKIIHALFAAGRMREAIEALLSMQSDLKGEGMGKEMGDWLDGFKRQCLGAAESLGEEALRNDKYNEAIVWYSLAMDLKPSLPEHLFMKRSEAFAGLGTEESWESALTDVNKVIALNPSLPQAYDMRLRMLHNLGRHDEIAKTLDEIPKELHDPHADANVLIHESLRKTLHNIPLRLIDTKTGHLCEETRLRRAFQNDPVFRDLIVAAAGHMDIDRITPVVQGFFRYVMFSHRWQGREPLRSDVGDQSVYSLPTEEMPTVFKLQKFCKTAESAGYRWAWSDTCCIDQKNQREFVKSINSMFRWYHNSSLTLVYLWDVSPSSSPGRLILCEWVTRGWTLQELLAPTVIRFFNNDWTPYLFDSRDNHKESEVIMKEIAQAVGVSANDLLNFQPSSDDVYWKLRMASKRETTVPEDTAYCLYGIFSVVMSDIPGETQQQAVGRLLQEIIKCSKSGDVGCLAWVGEPSELNSCLPAHVRAYQRVCHMPASIAEETIHESAEELASSFSDEDEKRALALYTTLAHQPRAEFRGWRLHLPCIVFQISAAQVDHSSDVKAYTVSTAELEPTRICMTGRLPKGSLLVCPWTHELVGLTPLHGHQDTESSAESPSDRPTDVWAPSLDEGPERSIRSRRHDGDHSPSGYLQVQHEHSGPPTPVSFPSTLPSVPFDERTRALRFVARLRQPMTALLLSYQRHHRAYKRIATHHSITIRLREEAPLDRISVQVVEVI